MHEDRPSLTAHRVAVRRAAHQLLDRPLVFEDPLALRILGAEARAALEADPAGAERSPISSFLRIFLAIRSRFAEERLAAAYARGVRQYVLLGAGLDTFAYRNPYPDLRVFEVDHPASQAWKRGRLAEGAIAIPPSLTFVPLDFERHALPDALGAAGFAADAAACFAWLGVTMYLTAEAFAGTLAWIAARPAGSEVVFDYALSPERHDAWQAAVFAAMSARVAQAGEPWRTWFTPEVLLARLHAAGFDPVLELGPEAITERYLAGRSDDLRVGSLARLVSAVVAAPPASP